MLGAGIWTTKVAELVDATVGGKYVRTTRFASIGAGTSGTVAIPSNSAIVLDDFGGTVDAVVTTISGGKPTRTNALTALGAIISTTFDSSGNWVLSGTPSSYPVAIVYRVQQTLGNFSSTDADIWGEVDMLDPKICAFGVSIDGGGAVITTGQKGYITIPFACKIQGWTILGDVAGAIVVDVWKQAYASGLPAVAQTIAGSEKPTIAASGILGFNVDSCTSIKFANLVIQAVRT